MLNTWLRALLVRDLKAMRREVESYADEKDLWKTPAGVSNSAGNLVMHCAGNIQFFIGAQLGNTGYKRDRDAEFGKKDVPRQDLIAELEAAITSVQSTLPGLRDQDLEATYTIKIGEKSLTTGDFLLHLAAHLTYHLGQIDYHRRIVTGQAGSIKAVMPTELSSAV